MCAVPSNEGVPMAELSLETARALAFRYVPRDATRDDAKGWVLSQLSHLTREDRALIVDLHLHDEVVRMWRLDSLN